jgi:two-component system sensor histidine kinase KdpD
LAACTWVAFGLGQSFAFIGFLHLVVVVLAAMYGGFWQATFVSLAAVACLDYFFIPPIFSFANSPANWVALGAFEFTALVISRLSLRAQLRAAEAIAGRRDMERLYETSRRMLLLESSVEQGNLIVSVIQEVFELKAVRLLDALTGTTYQCGEATSSTAEGTRRAHSQGLDTFDPDTNSWHCVLRLGAQSVGGLTLSGAAMNSLAATSLASLCGIALERARALRRESCAEAARQAEQLRTAVLDALAHQFKTPLTVARTASSGLLAVGGLTELQADMVNVIDEQANILDQLASRLLGAAMLDSTEFNPKCESLLLSQLIGSAVEKLQPQADRDRFHISVSRSETPAHADRELILTALFQLVDNAIKYSEPGSPVYVVIEDLGAQVRLTLRSKGPVVAPLDCKRIFERFYRAPGAHHLPAGTGLGLSIVRKIVEAHGGSAWAEGETDYGTSFSIALPAARPRR